MELIARPILSITVPATKRRRRWKSEEEFDEEQKLMMFLRSSVVEELGLFYHVRTEHTPIPISRMEYSWIYRALEIIGDARACQFLDALGILY